MTMMCYAMKLYMCAIYVQIEFGSAKTRDAFSSFIGC